MYGVLEKPGNLPIAMAEGTILLKPKRKDKIVAWNDIRFPKENPRLDLWKEQTDLEV